MPTSTFRGALVVIVSLWLTACGPSIYLAQDFRAYAPKHKTVAILPADVTIRLRPNQARYTSDEQQRDMQNQTGREYQEKIYAWLLRRSQERGYTVQFQDVRQTLARLHESDISQEQVRAHAPQELAKLLGVDAVLTTSVLTTKPMSEGAAVALGVAGALMGGAITGTTNQAKITVNIHEAEAGKLLWRYDYLASGSVFSSADAIVNALMRNASKKFPYTAKS